MVESGITVYLKKKLILEFRKSHGLFDDGNQETGSSHQPLNIVDMQSAFLILGCGYILAIVTLIFENLLYFFKRSKDTQKM